MAKRAGAKSKATPPDPSKTIIEAALRLAAAQGWQDLSLVDIAAEAKMPLAEVYAHFSSKQAVLRGFSRMIDQQVLASDESVQAAGNGAAEDMAGEAGEPARDRLFEVLMRRFDALQPYRDGVSRIVAAMGCDPLMMLCSGKQLRRSMAAMLEAADLSAGGCRGVLRIKGLSAVYLSTLRVWMKDDSEDMAKTMAALDKNLSRSDQFVRRVRSFRPQRA